MLILTRQINESLVIGNNITVTVTNIKGDRVLLGVQAPKDITVNREEIHNTIQEIVKKHEQNHPTNE